MGLKQSDTVGNVDIIRDSHQQKTE